MVMMKANWRRQWGLLLLLLCFCLGSALVLARGASKNNAQKPGNSSPLIRMDIQQRQVVMDNGHVIVTLSIPGGMVTQISYMGIPNVLDATQKESVRGYWDLVWSMPEQAEEEFQTIEGASFQVIDQNEDKIELSFKLTYSPSMGSSALPLNIDKRFVMLPGQSGFYSYAIYERLEGWPALDIAQTRIAFKLNQNLFHYMAIADDKQRIMPTAQDRLQGQRLAYPEAVLLKNPSTQDEGLKEEVDDKYQYSLNNEDNQVHGWVSTDKHVGFWVIIPSYEFKTGGPFKQELTSHVGPTSLAAFHTRHYAGTAVKGLSFETGEPWKKVFGPIFVYLNSGPENASSLWNDAKQQSQKEIRKWPYNFTMSPDYPPTNQRASVNGRILVNDGHLKMEDSPVAAYVGLAAPGEPGSWQMAAKGYQFWSRTDSLGGFSISNVRAGNYSLYAWIPGIFGDYKYESDIMVKPGDALKLPDAIVFNPPRNGPTIWEIGIPDRSAAEFFVPDPAPGLVNPLLIHNQADKYRQYGLWDRYTDLYPDRDLIFKIGISNYQKDWFFAQVNRRTANNIYISTIWQISFDLKAVNSSAIYTFRLALASASSADIQVRINDPLRRYADFSTNLTGTDNAIARHGIHGLYWAFSFDIPGKRLVVGTNSIFLRQARGGYIFNGAMYDYLRLEGPTG